jgi:hypothetical protein
MGGRIVLEAEDGWTRFSLLLSADAAGGELEEAKNVKTLQPPV